jgi:hypothetical protein
MRPRERQETGEQDLFRSRLDRIIDLTHALVKLSRAIKSTISTLLRRVDLSFGRNADKGQRRKLS